MSGVSFCSLDATVDARYAEALQFADTVHAGRSAADDDGARAQPLQSSARLGRVASHELRQLRRKRQTHDTRQPKARDNKKRHMRALVKSAFWCSSSRVVLCESNVQSNWGDDARFARRQQQLPCLFATPAPTTLSQDTVGRPC